MYRIVVADSRAPRDGRIVESIGYYHPLDNPSTIVIDGERVRLWLDRGAQPSERVAKILAIEGIAELPAKLKTRIALGEERAKAKPKPETPTEDAPAAEAKPEEAPAEAPADAAPAAEVTAEEKPADATPAEPKADAEPSEETQPAAGEKEQPQA